MVQLKSIVPTVQVEPGYDATGEMCYCRLKRLGDKTQAVASWVKKILCDNGFEPFSLEHSGGSGMIRLWAVHFRNAVEE